MKTHHSLSQTAWRYALTLSLGLLSIPNPTAASQHLEDGFLHPPEATKPWCYWYWISDNISREGITRDLEAMAQVGIGEALIGNIFLEEIPAGEVKVLSDAWWDLVTHAIREAGRVGVNLGMFNSPGWSQSGGPWVQPDQAMRYLVSSELRVQGPQYLEEYLEPPAHPFQDVAVLAFPAPGHDTDTLNGDTLKITTLPKASGTEHLVDGTWDTTFTFPAGAGQGDQTFTIHLELNQPFTARSLALVPSDSPWSAQCELQVANQEGDFHTVRSFRFDRSNMAVGVGPMPRGPVQVSFPSAIGSRFRLRFNAVTGVAALAEVTLSGAARLESYIEKQLGKMHPTPLPRWDTYLWPDSPEPESSTLTIAPDTVIDLTSKLSPESTLRWQVPPGDWIILRTGMTPTGTRNSPASPEGQGLEIDKMNRAAARAHFDAFIGQVLKRLPASQRSAFRHVVADSYEMGSQNWTDGFARTFRKRYGYDPKPWLPVLTGRIVQSADQSNRFLWDLRRLIADHIAKDYVGGLRDLCHPHDLELWLENYGHWGFPAEFLQYGGQSDRIGGEFWVTGDLGSIECRAASSAANTYGKPLVSAEAFTGGPPFQTMPSGLKARGDWAFCEGINHLVLHVYIHQPWETRRPGVNAWFGTEFNRHNTWFDSSRTWIDYLRRCSFLLQQGWRVADAAYFIGEDTPKMTGLRHPPLPPGRDFDYLNAEVIHQLRVRDGWLTLPHGTAYPVLVLPELTTMRPELLRRIARLIKSGATIVGPPPQRSPSLENFPQCDLQVQKSAHAIWGDTSGRPSGNRPLGQGRVFWGHDLESVFATLELGPDFLSDRPLRFTHRRAGDTDLYFVANPETEPVTTATSYRVGNRAPELWWPETGRIERPAVYDTAEGTVRLPLHLDPLESVFVVFRKPPTEPERIVSVTRDGQLILETAAPALPQSQSTEVTAPPAQNFTMAVWARPAADTTLLPETNRGVHGMAEARNDALFPPHGNLFGASGHAGAGLAVGRNGVCVFEHGANYFTPLLVFAVPLTNWTHVTVVYREGRPELYLDGRLVRQGLQSELMVHPGTARAGGGGHPFQGDLGEFRELDRALHQEEVAALAQSMPRPTAWATARPLTLFRNPEGHLEGEAWQPGVYSLQTASGQQHTLEISPFPEPYEITGPWTVSFEPGLGAPETVALDTLVSWTDHPDAGVRCYSGRATYRNEFNWPAPQPGEPQGAAAPTRHVLDLGVVRDLARVRLNGQEAGTLWLAPWRLDISSSLRPGRNVLEIEVVNAWNNRLVGDKALPAEQRHTFLAKDTLPANAPLLPAGLLGPVVIVQGRQLLVAE